MKDREDSSHPELWDAIEELNPEEYDDAGDFYKAVQDYFQNHINRVVWQYAERVYDVSRTEEIVSEVEQRQYRTEHWSDKSTRKVIRDKFGRFINWWRA